MSNVSGDVVVIGGGLAGLTCANRAAELGLRALVLERGGEPTYPCNSRYSGGIVHVAFKDMLADPADIGAAIEATTGEEPSGLTTVMAEESERALAWLRGEGARFIKGGALEFMRWVLAPPRPRRPGLDWKGRGPDVLLRNLTANLEGRGGVVRLSTRARELVLDGDRVAGVVAERDGASGRIAATSVVIADGGFQGNADLVRRYIAPSPEKLFQRGAGTGGGDGVAMAEAAGARLTGMDRFYGHLLGREVFQNERLWPYPTVDAIAQASILVDGAGRRFLDEGLGGVYMANEVARLDDPLSTTVIFDDAVWTGIAADNRYPPCMNPSFVSVGGTVLEAGDLAGLAAIIGVPADALAETVARYNDGVRDGEPGRLTPPRSSDRQEPQPIVAPPFHAIQVCAGITYTMGGIAIDDQARVLREEGGAVPGLYAVGSSSGGMEGGARAAYLGGLAKAVITGLRAAEAIAAEHAAA